MADPFRFTDKLISVKGIYYRGVRQNCAGSFVTNTRVWPSAIYLIGTREDVAYSAIDFVTDYESWNKVDERVLAVGRNARKAEIWVTVEGFLRGPRHRPDGTIVGGFGEQGIYPAELVVKRIYGVDVSLLPTYDYGALLPSRKLHE
jgi:hypothetical protein